MPHRTLAEHGIILLAEIEVFGFGHGSDPRRNGASKFRRVFCHGQTRMDTDKN
jgi:hypothetical protein